jgi:hypothetical protein
MFFNVFGILTFTTLRFRLLPLLCPLCSTSCLQWSRLHNIVLNLDNALTLDQKKKKKKLVELSTKRLNFLSSTVLYWAKYSLHPVILADAYIIEVPDIWFDNICMWGNSYQFWMIAPSYIAF